MQRDKWHQVGGGSGDFIKWEQEGQTIEGHWRGQHDGKFGPLGTVTLPDGKSVRFPLHTALLDRVRRIREGAEILIRYGGKQKGKKGQEYKSFEVFVADPEQDLLSEPAEADGEAPF